MKKEVTLFKKRYINYLKINNSNSDICVWLENAVDFERPDGYYFDSNKNLLVLFEHFDIDCSERIIEKVMPKVKPDTNAAEILEFL